jgi:hypothetical protein
MRVVYYVGAAGEFWGLWVLWFLDAQNSWSLRNERRTRLAASGDLGTLEL